MTKIVFHFDNLTSPIVKFKRNSSGVPVQAKYCFVSSSITKRVKKEMALIWSQDSDRVPSKAQQMSNIADKINFHLSFGGTRTPVCLSSFTWERFRSHFSLEWDCEMEWILKENVCHTARETRLHQNLYQPVMQCKMQNALPLFPKCSQVTLHPPCNRVAPSHVSPTWVWTIGGKTFREKHI